jgi:hypothetical protein
MYYGPPVQVANTNADGSGTPRDLLTDATGHLLPVTDWQVSHLPATATKATVTKAAGGAGMYHVITVIHASLAAAATGTGPLTVTIVEETTGNVLFAGAVSAISGGNGQINLTGLKIKQPTANKGLTLEFSGAGSLGSQQAVTLCGFTVPA